MQGFQLVILSAGFLIGLIYAVSNRDLPLTVSIGILFLLNVLRHWTVLTAESCAGLLLVFISTILIWFYYFRSRQEYLRSRLTQKEQDASDMNILNKKYKSRVESLNHLEHQVGGLLELFEVAKDFNECLYFDQLMNILSKRVREQLPFSAFELYLFSQNPDNENAVTKIIRIGKGKLQPELLETVSAEENQFAIKIKKMGKAYRFDAPRPALQLKPHDHRIAYPMWVFPLQVEDRVIAVISVEGAAIDDFPKFELLASQLALQVKKVSLYETVKELSIVDGLTKVYVRRHFLERFEEELRRAIKRKSTVSVLMLDIDHFKRYNDQFGHLVGDGTLREVAAVIRECVRKVDLVSRYGGEEFVIAMPGISRNLSIEIAERIRSAIARKRFRLYDEHTQVTVSIGAASFPDDLDRSHTKKFQSDLIVELIRKADKAMYRAKEDGRNRVCSYQQIDKGGTE